MIDKLCVLIIATCFFVAGIVIGWKLGKTFGESGYERRKADDKSRMDK